MCKDSLTNPPKGLGHLQLCYIRKKSPKHGTGYLTAHFLNSICLDYHLLMGNLVCKVSQILIKQSLLLRLIYMKMSQENSPL